jgi:hypothetical protein
LFCGSISLCICRTVYPLKNQKHQVFVQVCEHWAWWLKYDCLFTRDQFQKIEKKKQKHEKEKLAKMEKLAKKPFYIFTFPPSFRQFPLQQYLQFPLFADSPDLHTFNFLHPGLTVS